MWTGLIYKFILKICTLIYYIGCIFYICLIYVYTIKVFYQNLGFWRKIDSRKKAIPFTRLKFCQSLINVSISIYILAVNSKTINRSWFQRVNSHQNPSKVLEKYDPSKSIKILWQSFWCRFTRSENFVKENVDQETQKKYISMKNSQFFNYLLYAKSK